LINATCNNERKSRHILSRDVSSGRRPTAGQSDAGSAAHRRAASDNARMSRGRTHLMACPSSPLAVPSKRRQTNSGISRWKLVIAVARKGQRRQAGLPWWLRPQARSKFPNKRGFGRFARLDFATRELPQPGQLLAFGRCVNSTLPSASTSAQAATSNIFLSFIVSVSRFLAIGVAIDFGKAETLVERDGGSVGAFHLQPCGFRAAMPRPA
jgi:hypothetical protein